MAQHHILYYITDRTAFGADEPTRRRRLLHKIAEAARAGVDYVQLREKDLPTRELETLTREAVDVLRKLRTENRELRTALLINSRTDVALATGADGVHLRADDISPRVVAKIWARPAVKTGGMPHVSPVLQDVGILTDGGRTASATVPDQPLIAVSCHTPDEVRQAGQNGATFAVFAPVFEKKDVPATKPAGLTQLREACKVTIPVLALGGVTLKNAQSCLEAGASGIAAIRLFQENEIAEIVARLRHQ